MLPLPRRGLRGLRGAFEGPETQTNAAQGAATLGFVLFSVLFGLTSNDGEEPLPHMCDTGERSAQDASNIQICFVFSLGWKNNTPALSKECCRWHGRHGGGRSRLEAWQQCCRSSGRLMLGVKKVSVPTVVERCLWLREKQSHMNLTQSGTYQELAAHQCEQQ